MGPKELGKNLLGPGNGMASPSTSLWNSLANIEPFRYIQSQWAKGVNVEAICIDEKSLRGSKRKGGLPALQVVVAVGQEVRLVLGREGVYEEKITEAALKLLKGIPIEWMLG